MRRIFLSLLFVASLTISFAQASGDISHVISVLNEACPTSAGPNLTFTEIELTPAGVVLHYEVNEQNMSVETLEAQKAMLHDVYVSEIITSADPNMQALRKFSIDSAKPLIYRFKGVITDETFDITLTPAEIK